MTTYYSYSPANNGHPAGFIRLQSKNFLSINTLTLTNILRTEIEELSQGMINSLKQNCSDNANGEGNFIYFADSSALYKAKIIKFPKTLSDSATKLQVTIAERQVIGTYQSKPTLAKARGQNKGRQHIARNGEWTEATVAPQKNA